MAEGDVGQAVPLVPVLAADVVRLKVQAVAVGHVPGGVVARVEGGGDVPVVAPAVQDQDVVEVDPEEALGRVTATRAVRS